MKKIYSGDEETK